MNGQGFNEGMKAKLVAAGYNANEMQLGALMAEMHAALKLVSNPLAVMAISNTFSKALAHLSVKFEVAPQRISAVGDMIFESAMEHAAKQLGLEDVIEQSTQPAGKRTVMTADLDDLPATDPKDIN